MDMNHILYMTVETAKNLLKSTSPAHYLSQIFLSKIPIYQKKSPRLRIIVPSLNV